MTQAALTVIGYAVGYYFGGPTGGSIGAAIGGAIGGYVAAPDIVGPRINDTTIQVSNYGTAIAKVWGSDRNAGNVIWAQPIEEVASEDGGKGGPTVTTFSYNRTFAVLLQEGPITAVRRIWADAKLVYDVSETASQQSLVGSEDLQQYMTVYPGTEDQLPDPTMESFDGVGNVPAYRGWAYVVFNHLPLGPYGNRVPNLRFETSQEPPAEFVDEVLQPLGVPAWRAAPDGRPIATPANPNDLTAVGPMEFFSVRPFIADGGPYSTFGEAVAAAQARALTLGGSGDAHGNAAAGTFIGFYTGTNATPSVFTGGATVADDPEWVYYIYVTQVPDRISDALGGSIVGCDDLQAAGIDCTEDATTVLFSAGTWADSNANGGLTSYFEFGGSAFINNCHPEGWPPVCKAFRSSANVIRGRRLPRCQEQVCFEGDPCKNVDQIAQLPGHPTHCITCAGEISGNNSFEEDSHTYKQLTVDQWTGSGLARRRVRPAQGPIIRRPPGGIDSLAPNYNSEFFWTQAALASTYGVPGPYNVAGGAGFYPQIVDTVCRAPTSVVTVATSTAILGDIVADICVAAGLSLANIDTSELTDEVLGYTVARQMPARNAIEPLRTAFYFDAVESGDKIRFVKRGGAISATLYADDLAAGLDGSTGEPVETTRAQETELPASVQITYKAIEADYEVGTQSAQRTVTSSRQIAAVEVPVVLTDAHAAQIADVVLYDAWVSRNSRAFQATIEQSQLEPTDVVQIIDGGFTYRLYISDRTDDGGTLSFKSRDEDPGIYVLNSTAAPTSGGGDAVTIAGPTLVELMDIPLLREDDDDAGFYAAACGLLSGWRGALLLRSLDGGANYASLQEMKRAAVIGLTRDALGDYTGGNTVDEINSVTVEVHGSVGLSSITSADLLNNGNAALLGDEIIQFKRAELQSERIYKLTGLLRGRRGTEQHMATHAALDRFVLLSTSTVYRPPSALSEVNVASLCKAVTVNGGSLGGTPAIDFINTAAGLRPLAPVHLFATPTPTGYLVSWVRRTRLGGAWIDGVDAPLGEGNESYRVRVFDGDDELESQTVTEPEASIGLGTSNGALTALLSLAQAAYYLSESGTDMIGLLLLGADRHAVKFNAAGAFVAQSPILGDYGASAAHGATCIYVLANTLSPSGLSIASTHVYRIDYSDVTTIAATKTAASGGDYQGIAFDGTSVWITDRTAGELLKCDSATLGTLDTFPLTTTNDLGGLFYSGGFLWITTAAEEVIQWDTIGESEVDRCSVTGLRGLSVVAGDGLVFVLTSNKLWWFNDSGLALVGTDTAIFTTGTPLGIARLGDFIVMPNLAHGTQFFDAATGAKAAIATAGADFVGGFRGADHIFLSTTASGGLTVEYAFGGSIAPADYTGMTIEVCQISAAIGPGFPATASIP